MAIPTKKGDAGNNTLDGAGGLYNLIGFAGDDIYKVDLKITSAGSKYALEDIIKESTGGGSDTVQLYGIATILPNPSTLKLAANLENLDASNTGSIPLNLTGNASNNILTGNDAANILDGGKGADTLIGGTGNDIYIVDNKDDVVIETSPTDIDTVKLSAELFNSDVTRDNSQLQNIENLILIGTRHINGYGNELSNTIQGNTGNNQLYGGGGTETDTLMGGKGNDLYFVPLITKGTGNDVSAELQQDTITEYANQGSADILYPVVFNSLGKLAPLDPTVDLGLTTLTTLIIPANFERISLVYTGITTELKLLGNTANNVMWGNDTSNIIDGGLGADTMLGRKGDDIYVVDNLRDKVYEASNEGNDTVLVNIATANRSFTLSFDVENAILTNTVNFKLTGNALDNELTGNAAANTLTGANGADLLIGGLGKDTYNLKETVAATDTVRIAEGDSLVGGFDVVKGFNLSNDKLDLASNNIAANATINHSGNDSGVIHSHRINNGIITFDDSDTYAAPLAINSASIASAVAYLQANITGKETVAFTSGSNSYVYQDGDVHDTLVQLTGVNALSLESTGLSEWVI